MDRLSYFEYQIFISLALVFDQSKTLFCTEGGKRKEEKKGKREKKTENRCQMGEQG